MARHLDGKNGSSPERHRICYCVHWLSHACKCRKASCFYMQCYNHKRLLRHARTCTLKASGNCEKCREFALICYSHAKECRDSKCQIVFCPRIKNTLRSFMVPKI